MNSQEMIDKFLEDSKVTVCPDEDRTIEDDGHLRYGVGMSKSNLKMYGARNVEKFNCEICGCESSVISKDDPHRGKCNGVYKGDSWCDNCRHKEIEKGKLEHRRKVSMEKMIMEFGSKDIVDKFLKATIIKIYEIRKIKTKDELSDLISELEWCLNRRKSSNKSILKKIEVANIVKNKIKEVVSDDMDDWDKPLGDWR